MPDRDRSDERYPTTILFTDIVDSTQRAAELGDAAWGEILRSHHATVRRELRAHGGHEVDNAGDGFFAAFASPAAAIRCACAIVDAVRPLGIEVRAGVHVGESVRVGEKPGGMAVHIGSRIAGAAGPGEVAVSGTVRDLTAGSGIVFEDRGVQPLKGVEGEWRIYGVLRRGDLAPRELQPERPPPERAAGARSPLRRWAMPAGAAALAIVILAFALTRGDDGDPGGPGSSPSVTPPPAGATYGKGVFVIDPETNAITQGSERVAPANPILPYGDSVWVGSGQQIGLYSPALDDYVVRYDTPVTFGQPYGFVVARGSLWVTIGSFTGTGRASLYRLDPRGQPELPEPVELETEAVALVYTEGEFWSARKDRVERIDVATGRVTKTWPIPGVQPLKLIADGRILFVLDSINAGIERVDLRTGAHRRLPIPNVLDLALGDGRLWVTTANGQLLGLDPDTLLPEITNPFIPRRSFAIAISQDSLWIGSREGLVARVSLSEPEDEPVLIDLGVRVESIALAATDRVVWLGVGCVSSGSGGCVQPND